MSDGASPPEVAKQLALEALRLGSNDNISVVCVKARRVHRLPRSSRWCLRRAVVRGCVQLGDGVPRGSIRRGPAMLAMMESSMTSGGSSSSPTNSASSGGSASTATTGSGYSTGSTRKIYSSNPFSKSYNPGDASKRPGATPASATPSTASSAGSSGGGGGLGDSGSIPRKLSGVHVESMLSAMRLTDNDGDDTDNSMKLPPPSYQTPRLSGIAGGGGTSDSPSANSYFSVPGIPTYPSTVVTAPSFGGSPRASNTKSAALTKQEEEALMDAILNDMDG